VERFDLENLSELDVMKQYHIKFSIKFAALENLSDSENINRGLENIKEYIRTSAEESLGPYELQQLKPWFNEECFQILDQRKQAKIQRLQQPNQNNVDNLNNVRREISRHFKNKRKGHRKAKIDDMKLTIR
jgi:hypothetical protein